MTRPDPKVIDEMIRLSQALMAAEHSGEGVEEARKAYHDYYAKAAAAGISDGATAEAFGDVLADDAAESPAGSDGGMTEVEARDILVDLSDDADDMDDHAAVARIREVLGDPEKLAAVRLRLTRKTRYDEI